MTAHDSFSSTPAIPTAVESRIDTIRPDFVCKWSHEMRPGRHEMSNAVGRRIDGFSDQERIFLLHWLAGYNPVAVAKAMDREWP